MSKFISFLTRKKFSTVALTLTLCGCASNISHDRYTVDVEKNHPVIEVVRDARQADQNSETEQCKTNFYIDDTKVGSFAINDRANYQLSPGVHSLAVNNCQDRCSQYALEIEIKQDESKQFVLSADATGKPFIIVNQ